jgi:hypothetical protein
LLAQVDATVQVRGRRAQVLLRALRSDAEVRLASVTEHHDVVVAAVSELEPVAEVDGTQLDGTQLDAAKPRHDTRDPSLVIRRLHTGHAVRRRGIR